MIKKNTSSIRTPAPRGARLDLYALGAMIAASGCGDSTEAPGTTTQNLSFPADVARVIQDNCASCHTATPQFGAPMSLMTWADTQRAAVTQPSRRVWQLMGERVHDASRPMPPSRLDSASLAVIDAWVRAGAPGCSGASCGRVNAAVDTSTRLPCTPSHTFTAHAEGATTPYTVRASAGNVNVCYAFRSPFATPTHATAFGPHIDNASALHHMILFATNEPQREGAVFECGESMPRDARFVNGWSPGVGAIVMPPDVGAELPGGEGWFILQIHYWNLTPREARDASGFELCTTTALRPHTATVSTLGSLDIAIPPRVQDHAVVGECRPTATEPIHLLNAGPHMHRNGLSLRTEVLRGGDASRRETVVDVPQFGFDAQRSYPLDMVVMPGDVLRTTCRYQNPSAETIRFGERTEDEMCLNFVLAWPAGALANAVGAARRGCVTLPQ